MFCNKCGKEIVDDAVVCIHCGRSVGNGATQISYEEDKVSVGLCVLSVFVPLFGIIYWPLKHNETPKKAKACGIAAIISWGASIVLSFAYSFIIALLASSMMYM